MSNSEQKGVFLITAVMIYWGMTTVLMKNALLYMNSSTYIMLRFTSAAILLVCIYIKRYKKQLTKSLLIKGCILGALLIIPMEFTVLGLSFTSVSNSVFISQLSFVIVPLIVCIKDRRLPQNHLWSAIVGLCVGLFIFSDIYHIGINKGDLITIVSAVFNSVGIIIMAKFTKEEEPKLLGVLQIIFAAIFSIFIGITNFKPVIFNFQACLILFLTGIIGTGIAFVVSAIGQSMVNPILTSFLHIINPIFGMIGAAIIPGEGGNVEKITIYKLVGSIIIVFSLVFYIYIENKYYFNKANRS